MCSIKFDDRKIDEIKEFDVFKLEPKTSKKPKPPVEPVWNAWNVLPTDFEEWGFTKGLEWSLRKLCDIATGGDIIANELYFNEKPLSEIWALLATIRSNLFVNG